MERNYDEEISALKKEMEDLKNTLMPQLEEMRDMVLALMPRKPSVKKLKRVEVMQGMHLDSRLSELMEELCYRTEERGGSGLVTYLGIYNSGGRQSNWIKYQITAEDLLSLIENGMAGKVLACIGNQQRLEILLQILRGPRTVAELVEKCGFGSAGQVYHHIKPLLAADIIVEDTKQRGVYVVQPHKVQGIIMLLAGISDMVDETYTQGVWETES